MHATGNYSYRGTECTAIVMETHSFYLEISAVHPEAGSRVKMKFSNTKSYGLFIDGPAIRSNPRDSFVKEASADIPKLRVFNSNFDAR